MAGIELANLRLGFACKQRWEDMVGDDRVRACKGCHRDVFNLSAMTREEAEAVLAARGVTPCVRFYRRPDGTVMTTDCPTGVPRERRRLAVVASSFAAGTALAAPAMAEPDSTTDPNAANVATEPVDVEMGGPVSHWEVGVIEIQTERPKVEWSTWGRLGMGVGVASQQPAAIARRLVPAMDESSSTISEAAAGADLTFHLALDGDLRVGAWGELRTTSEPVAGGELVLEGLPPHPRFSRIGGEGSLVFRAGGNAHVVTGALGFGYIGSFPDYDPWIRWALHVVGARLVVSANRSLDDPRDWSVTVGLEIDPIGAVHAVYDRVTRP